MGGDVLNEIEMFNAAEQMRRCVFSFNINYQRQEISISAEAVSLLRDIYQAGMSDKDYWNNTGINLEIINELTGELERAILESNWVYVYDKLNVDIAFLLKTIFEVLFTRSAVLLENWIWEENRVALRERYPIIEKQLEKMADDYEKDKQFVRSYGLRGKVVCRQKERMEYDLYSSYDPAMVGVQIEQKLGLEKYEKLYVWGFNGGYECTNQYVMQMHRKTPMEIYVVNLTEFKRILQHTYRKGFILSPVVEWKFNFTLQDFFNHIDLSEKDDSYIYVTEYSKEELPYIREFINRNSLNSNIR